MRVTIIPEDKTVVVGGTAHRLPQLASADANIHAIQFFHETGHATIEKKFGDREHVTGEAAAQLVKPFIDAHTAHTVALQAQADADATERAASEKAEVDRIAKIKADIVAQDKAADERAAANRAAEAEVVAKLAAQSKGNMTSSGTQVI